MRTDEVFTLRTDWLGLVVDAGRGADILSLTDQRTGVDVFFSTPWRHHADRLRRGLARPSTYDPVAGWMEQYRGGLNTLCPNGGAPRLVAGAPVGFHGEAASARWQVLDRQPDAVSLSATLFSVPIAIDRELQVTGPSVVIEDVLTNQSDVPLEIDYVYHPAFGGEFLDGRCVVDTGARRYTADPSTEGSFVAPGTEHAWPWAIPDQGGRIDLRDVPPPTESRMAFGWLSDFDGSWASITNTDLGLSVRLEWDGTHMPYAWFWQELNWTEGFPWHRRARAFAIEPSSTQTGGPARRSVLVLGPEESVRIPLTITLAHGVS
jgi:hypothetical protein